MSIGYGGTLNVSVINAILGDLAVRLNAISADVAQFTELIDGLDHDGLVELGFSGTPGLTDGDAQGVLAATGALNGLCVVLYLGQDALPEARDYQADLAEARGPRAR